MLSLVIEVIELSYKKCSYFLELWNWIDCFFILMTLLYFSAKVLSDADQWSLLTLLNFSAALKTLRLLSLFKSTRVVLRILLEIMKDMLPFLVICVFATLWVTLLFSSSSPSSSNYFDNLGQVFKLEFGDFEDEYSGAHWFVVVIGVLLVPLILLNMLIAILEDTHDRVKEDEARRDF